MGSYAHIKDGACASVIVAEADFIESTGEEYVLLKENSIVGIGWTYDAATRTFSQPMSDVNPELVAPVDLATETEE